VAGLVVFFAAFNLLEANLPSLISKVAPVGAKGAAVGVYSSVQFLGTFVGAAAGGFVSQHFGAPAVFALCGLLTLSWLLVAWPMSAPAALGVRT
jgi:predicted MFS family arabinose efflux permease